jgi:PII-like signaling protein
MPVIIEIVDTRERLEGFLELIEDKIDAGLVTLEKAEVRFYRSKKSV